MKIVKYILGISLPCVLCSADEWRLENEPPIPNQSRTFVQVVQPDESTNPGYGYMSLGTTPLYMGANIQGGYRKQWNYFGLDLGGRVGNLINVIEVLGHANALLYPMPNPNSQLYLGVGATAGMMINNPSYRDIYSYGKGIIGYEFKNRAGKRRFVQVDTSYPFPGEMGPITGLRDTITISYGIGF